MTDGDGQGVGNIGRFRERREVEFMLDRQLNLALGSSPGAGEDLFDLCGRIVKYGDSGLSRGKADDTSRVAHEDRGSRACVMGIELFDRQRFGRKGLDHLAESAMELL